jgi:hypothetical protein
MDVGMLIVINIYRGMLATKAWKISLFQYWYPADLRVVKINKIIPERSSVKQTA